MKHIRIERHFALEAGDTEPGWFLPSCSGPCNGGRDECKTPEACLIPVDETPLGWRVCDLACALVLVGFLVLMLFGSLI